MNATAPASSKATEKTLTLELQLQDWPDRPEGLSMQQALPDENVDEGEHQPHIRAAFAFMHDSWSV